MIRQAERAAKKKADSNAFEVGRLDVWSKDLCNPLLDGHLEHQIKFDETNIFVIFFRTETNTITYYYYIVLYV